MLDSPAELSKRRVVAVKVGVLDMLRGPGWPLQGLQQSSVFPVGKPG